jgi:hypothetical protein
MKLLIKLLTKPNKRVKTKYKSIVDKDKVIPNINLILNSNNNSIEYVFSKPAWRLFFKEWIKGGSTSSFNPYGHAVVRYNNKLMNISGQTDTPLINFFKPSDYLFTNDHMD